MAPIELKHLVYLTAGAGGMYCGSCMHDNTLARAMQQLGIDAQLVPIYTPIRTDENDVAVDEVFFRRDQCLLAAKDSAVSPFAAFF